MNEYITQHLPFAQLSYILLLLLLRGFSHQIREGSFAAWSRRLRWIIGSLSRRIVWAWFESCPLNRQITIKICQREISSKRLRINISVDRCKFWQRASLLVHPDILCGLRLGIWDWIMALLRSLFWRIVHRRLYGAVSHGSVGDRHRMREPCRRQYLSKDVVMVGAIVGKERKEQKARLAKGKEKIQNHAEIILCKGSSSRPALSITPSLLPGTHPLDLLPAHSQGRGKTVVSYLHAQ